MRHQPRRIQRMEKVLLNAVIRLLIATAIACTFGVAYAAAPLRHTATLHATSSALVRPAHPAPDQIAPPNAAALTSTSAYTLYLPLISFQTQPMMISGQVRFQQQGVADIQLLLQRCTSTECTIVASTRSDNDGTYMFAVTGLLTGEFYRVRFENEPSGGNAGNALYLAYWQSVAIPYPLVGPQIAGGNFDIANVPLSSPSAGAFIVEWTTAFVWEGRTNNTDRYVWGYIDVLGQECRSDILTEPQYLLAGKQPMCYKSYLSPRPWYVYVVDGEWAKGFGRSFETRAVTFITAQE